MAAEISEFNRRFRDGSDSQLDILQRPGVSVQPPVAISGAVARSLPFAERTRVVRLVLSASVRLRVYPVPTLADTTAVDPTGADGLSEFFPAGEHYLGVAAGTKLALIAASSS